MILHSVSEELASIEERCTGTPLMLEVNVPGYLTREIQDNIRREMEHCIKGTQLEGIPCVVTEKGMSLRLHSPLTGEQMDAIADRVADRIGEREIVVHPSRYEAYEKMFTEGKVKDAT